MSDPIDIDFEGETISARSGESLAAALTAHGVKAFRSTASGADRGIFCGMGVDRKSVV